MAAEIIQIDTQNLNTQLYNSQETNLISTFDINTSLSSSSYIEYFTYDLNQNLLTTNYNYTQYTVINDGQSAGSDNTLSQINIDPEQSLLTDGFDQGSYITYYNFLNKQIGSNIEQLYIAEISSDRTEVRLDSTVLSNLDIIEKTNTFIQERNDSLYFLDFYLNFGDNQLLISNNISLDNQDINNPTILVKLYEPLPNNFDLNSTLWVVTSIEESISYQVNFEDDIIIIQDTTPIKGPNFNLDLKDQVNNSSLEVSYTDLITTSLTSSQNQLNSLLEEKEIDINIDYTNFNNFIHFSSAQTRLENFYYKVSLIEQYSSSIAILNSTNSSSIAVGETSTVLENKISNIITNFDGYDYYLYYSSGSYAWPKTNTEPPYQLTTTTDPITLTWFGSINETNPYFGGIINSASIFDNENKDYLYYTIPEFLRDDPDNSQYELFIDMVAQHFDNIWIYYKDVTEKFNADNRLESGISKDIVADAIRDFGIKLYQNNFSNEDLYTAFLGLTPEGGLFPFPNITGSLPTPSGYEYINTLISASNDYLPLDDVNKSLYKRIYHNLPYLLKAKGTIPGLRALITSYGIPDTILRINEYGGKDKVEGNDWDYWQNEFNYAYPVTHIVNNDFIIVPWVLNSLWNAQNNVPNSISFRFKSNLTTPPISGSNDEILFLSNDNNQKISLKYIGTGNISGSYSGSIPDPYNQYAYLTYTPNISLPLITSSIYLPFYNNGWWSVMLNSTLTGSNRIFDLYASNKIYEGGNNNTSIGFFNSSSISYSSSIWSNPTDVSYGSYFEGLLQEVRHYTVPISESVFKNYVMNPYSIKGNSLNSGPDELAFRASLGGELYTGSISIHPKITGSWKITSSFPSDSNFTFLGPNTFSPNIEYFFYDQPIAGIQNAVSDKIRLEDNIVPQGDTLSAYRRIAQNSEISASYTPATNLLEVAFSPQDEINDDISSQIGYFNIGEFIGDPAFRSSQLTSYPDLDILRNSYFEKYTKNYNLFDYIRLIKFFDNSLFKMIKDFVPARTSLASGIVIKQHLLERNRYPQPQMSYSDLDISGTLKPQWNNYEPGTVEHFEGGAAGMFNPFNGINTSPYGLNGNGPTNRFGITQSWYETYPIISGSVTILHDSQDEFFNGEFSGSVILVTTQSLNQPYPLENVSFEYTPILYSNNLYNTTPNDTLIETQFLNSLTAPSPGEILIMVPRYGVIFFPTFTISRQKAFVKINKIDTNGNNNTIPLSQLTNLLIKYTTSTSYENYEILNINELPTYYLYEIDKSNIPFPNGAGIDNEIKNYYISSSRTTAFSNFTIGISTIFDYDAGTLGNTLGYFDSSSGIFTLQNTPNIPLQITASIPIDKLGSPTGTVKISIVSEKDGIKTLLHDTSFNAASVPLTLTLTASFTPLYGDQIYIQKGSYNGSGTLAVTNASFLITQSISPTASVQDPIILEPYITTPNYYNSDFNPIINNAVDIRKSSIYQDIDYSQGALVPVNFDLLINGDATKATVQDSNYTLARHINPRYNGSKTTSQKLNEWSPEDNNTYGKLPTVESVKTYVAYCETIGGYTPDRMNSSAAVIKYLIDENGTVSIPNTTENSLFNTQDNFITKEKIIINTNSIGSGETPYRNIIKGGYRIEPILYTQIGHSPAVWSPVTMSFTTNFVSDLTSVGDYQATSYPSANPPSMSDASFGGLNFNNNIYLGNDADPWTTNGYNITQSLIDENISLTIKGKIQPFLQHPLYGAQTHIVTVNLIYSSSISGESILQTQTRNSNLTSYNGTGITILPDMDFLYTLNPQDMRDGDAIFFRGGHFTSTYGPTINAARYTKGGSYFKIEQSPAPTNTNITSSGTNSIWGYPDNTQLFAITASQTLSNLYDKDFTQINITGSGFEPITLPWSLKIGDEFRFEGNEDNTFMVKDIFDVGDNRSTRISSTGSLEVQFNNSLPSSSINLDHFLIRRYVEDASVIIFEGFKPTNSTGPYIISPEFISTPLKKNIDTFIVDLTQKGLLP